jgi:hypothetical protein
MVRDIRNDIGKRLVGVNANPKPKDRNDQNGNAPEGVALPHVRRVAKSAA